MTTEDEDRDREFWRRQADAQARRLLRGGTSTIKAIPETPAEKQQRDHAMWSQYLRNSAERERDKDPVKSFWCAASAYRMGAISSTEAAQLCGLSRVGFLFKLPSVGVPISNLTVEDLDDEF